MTQTVQFFRPQTIRRFWQEPAGWMLHQSAGPIEDRADLTYGLLQKAEKRLEPAAIIPKPLEDASDDWDQRFEELADGLPAQARQALAEEAVESGRAGPRLLEAKKWTEELGVPGFYGEPSLTLALGRVVADRPELQQKALRVFAQDEFQHPALSVLEKLDLTPYQQVLAAAALREHPGGAGGDVLRALRQHEQWRAASLTGRTLLESLEWPACAQALKVPALKHQGSSVYLYEAVLDTQGVNSGLEAMKRVKNGGYDNSWRDARDVGKVFVEALPPEPLRDAALDYAASHLGSEVRALEAALAEKHPATLSEELRATEYKNAWGDARMWGNTALSKLPATPIRSAALELDLNHNGSYTRVYESILRLDPKDGLSELGPHLARLVTEVCSTDYQHAWKDSSRVAQAFGPILANLGSPACAAAARVPELKHVGSVVRLYQAAYAAADQSSHHLGRLGAQISRELRSTGYDHAWLDARRTGHAFVKELAERSPTPLARLALGPEMHHNGSYTRLYEAALENASLDTPKELAVVALELVRSLRSTTYQHADEDAFTAVHPIYEYLRQQGIPLPEVTAASALQEHLERLDIEQLATVGDSGEVKFGEDYLDVNGIQVPISD